MSDKADRRGWLNFLWRFSHALSQLNFMYRLVSLPSHLGNWADMTTKLLPLTNLAQLADSSEGSLKSKNKCSILWVRNSDS